MDTANKERHGRHRMPPRRPLTREKSMKLLNASVQPGDLFYIPAIDQTGDYGFVIARYIELIKPNLGHLIEVFSAFHTTPPACIEDVDTSSRLFRPVMCSLAFQLIPRWKILFSDPSYDKSRSGYQDIAIAFERELWKGGICLPLEDEDYRACEDATCWRMHHLIFRVNAHLAGLLGPNDAYDYHSLPANQRVDSPEAQARVIDVAATIDRLSRSWQISKKAKA